MTPHDTFLTLAAMAIDYPLASADRSRLEAHLAACPACARRASAYRGDALALGHLPAVILPERRGAEILAAALHPAAVGNPLRLLVLAALLGLLLVGSLAVGAQLLRPDDDLSVVVPPVATASPGPDASAGPDATETPLPPATAAAGEILVDFGDMVKVRIIDMSGRDVGQAPYGSVGPMAAWSPNGALVAYTDSASGKRAVVIWDATSATEVGRIADAYAPSWSPDGTQLAYCLGSIANPGDPCPEAWLAGATGTDARRLGGGWHGPLPWSPDGRWLLGPTLGTGTREPFQLIDVATGKATPLGDPGGCYEFPAWLPGPSAARGDGLTVVAIRDPGCTAMFPTPTVIVALDAATGRESRLTDGTAADTGLAVSPDGRWIAVGRSLTGQPGSQFGVVVMASDGSGARLLTPAGVSDSGPLWSPDGARILVQREQLVGETTGAPLGLGLQLIDPTSSATIAVPGTTAATGWAWRPLPASTQPGEPAPSAEPVGRTWTQATVPVVVDRPVGRINAVTAGGPGFVAVGRGCTGEEPTCEAIVWTSADGQTWVRAPASDATNIGAYFATSGPEIGMFDVAVGTPGIVAIGYAARPDLQATIWFSPDGTSWERIPLALDTIGADAGNTLPYRVHAVAWDGRSFVVVGEDRSGWQGFGSNLATAKARAAVWTSTDGRTWTRVPHAPVFDVGGFIDTTEDPESGGMRDVVAGPRGLVAIGSACTSKPVGCEPAAWTSSDGTSWERVADMPALSGRLEAIAASDRAYVAVGNEGCDPSHTTSPPSCVGLVLTSTDGRVWVQQPFEQPVYLRTVTSIGDRFFAAAGTGPDSVWISRDGSEWASSAVEGGPTAGVTDTSTEWHFAATPEIAVWLGRSTEPDDTAAWVSGATAP